MRNHTPMDRELREFNNQLDARRWAFDVAQHERVRKLLETTKTPALRESYEKMLRDLEARWPGKTLG